MIYRADELLLGFAALVAVLVAIELGFRLGLRNQPNADEPTRAHFAALQVALLGLLALIVAFTFSITVARFDARKELVIEESNAIGTTYLRARLLAEPHRKEVVGLLRAYVDEQLAFYAAGIDVARLEATNVKIASLQERLWMVAIVLSEQDPRSVPTGLFVQSLNGMIDLHASRSMNRFERRRRPELAITQCENRIGSGGRTSMFLVAPPRMNSRIRECP